MSKIIIEIEVPSKMVAMIVNKAVKMQLNKMKEQSGAIVDIKTRIED